MNTPAKMSLAFGLLATAAFAVRLHANATPQLSQPATGTLSCTRSNGQVVKHNAYGFYVDTTVGQNPRYFSVSLDPSHFTEFTVDEYFSPAFDRCVLSSQATTAFEDVRIVDSTVNATSTSAGTSSYNVITFSYTLLSLSNTAAASPAPISTPAVQAKALADFLARTK